MNVKRINKMVLIVLIAMIAIFSGNSNVYAYQEFPDYGALPQNMAYCDYEIYTSNDASSSHTYNGHHLFLVYDEGTIKWVNPNNGNLMKSGERWDTDRFLVQKVSYDASSLTSALVSNGKLSQCPTLYMKEIDNKYNLSISLNETSVSHGGVSGELFGDDGSSTGVEELEVCNYLAKLCTPGDFVGDTLTDLYIHRYSDGSISFNFSNPDFSNYTLNTSGVDEEYFKNGCPDDVYVDCGGVVSEGTAYCNVVKESACTYTEGESNGASGHKQDENKDINTGDKDSEKEHNNDGDIDCDKPLGDAVMQDIKDVLTWIRIAAPILVIVLGSVDFAKAVLADDPKTLSKATTNFIKRMLAAVALFFAPLIIMYLIDIFNNIVGQCSFDIRGL